ncbi:hypothetical protein AVEN_224329-1 [Araneus ventricosus]|uniref:Uncharacterized protein n=1 Tax=Araneus ventricosus TaxID=182803 RepID=A0A4Y2JWQ4_ARAVE|nr:hypothetical protein AVEN_224329-1 [Araneus ventricosus]
MSMEVCNLYCSVQILFAETQADCSLGWNREPAIIPVHVRDRFGGSSECMWTAYLFCWPLLSLWLAIAISLVRHTDLYVDPRGTSNVQLYRDYTLNPIGRPYTGEVGYSFFLQDDDCTELYW